METDVQLAPGYIETFAGNGKARSTGDGKRAVKAGIPLPHHVALDRDEKWLYFAESGSDRVRRVNLLEGTVHNFAGIGETCYSGDEGLCGEAGLYLPLDVACDSKNDLYVCDSGSNRIRKIDRSCPLRAKSGCQGHPSLLSMLSRLGESPRRVWEPAPSAKTDVSAADWSPWRHNLRRSTHTRELGAFLSLDCGIPLPQPASYASRLRKNSLLPTVPGPNSTV